MPHWQRMRSARQVGRQGVTLEDECESRARNSTYMQILRQKVQSSLFQDAAPSGSARLPFDRHWRPTCPISAIGGPLRPNHITLRRNILATLETLAETASEFGKQTRESIEELGRSGGRKLDEARDEIGAALHSAASSVRGSGHNSSAAIDNCSAHTADRLDATASYIEDHDLGDAVTGLRRFARRHLTGSLVAACTIGVLAGAFLSRATQTHGRSAESAQR